MNGPSASGRREIEARLRNIGNLPDGDIDLAEAALLLAALDRPGVPLERYRDHVALLQLDTARLGAELGAENSLGCRVEALRAGIVEQYGYQGDRLTYDDLQNANLMRVIDRRKGLPVALGILYIAAARHQGWSICGLNFPGHFLLSLELGGARVIVDPFDGAKALGTSALRELLKTFLGPDAELRPTHYAAASSRAILLRLQDNIKLRLLQNQRPQQALEVIEAMLIFAPGEARLWHEAGALHARLGNLRVAAMALQHFLDLGTGSDNLHDAATLLQQLKSRLN
jgi:regulator of sirC expression with transglutaminase-like and TPR domain